MAKIRSIETLSIDSTVLCCNFVNTVSSWKAEKTHDYLETYDHFIAWCLKLNVSDTDRLHSLSQLGKERPEEALAALNRIKEIRHVLRGLISAVASGDNDKQQLFVPQANLLLFDAASRQRLLYHNEKFILDQVDAAGDLTSPVWKAVSSLTTLLVNNDSERIKECPKCGWVFLDETKNASRKWCNSKACGSSDKAMRYNNRKKGTAS